MRQYFGDVSAALPLYSNYPYASTVVRLGPNGFIVAHKSNDKPTVTVFHPQEFDPPLEGFNIFTIQRRLNAPLMSFNFSFTSYNDEQARNDGTREAFKQALGVFWRVLEPTRFEDFCRDMATSEGVQLEATAEVDRGIDLIGRVYIDEPNKFVREEIWGFELKHFRVQRPSAALVREVEGRLANYAVEIDILCLISSGDLTSIGRNVVIESPRLRVWDRSVLDLLLHRHPDIMERYFKPYAQALSQIQVEWGIYESNEARFRAALLACPSGQRYFRAYEDLGLDLIRFLFPKELGGPRVQSRTEDGAERRDVLSRNNRCSRFFQRLSDRFEADFVIWDFKNYTEAITGEVINDVATYTNPALGRFIIIMARKGGNESARAAQLRRLRNDRKMILIISDNQILEMVRRKESGEAPEDVLEDLLDEMLLSY